MTAGRNREARLDSFRIRKLLRLHRDLALLVDDALPSDRIGLFSGLFRRLLVGDALAPVVLDLEHEVDLLERQTFGLDVKEPDDGEPGEVEDREDDVVSPCDVFDRCGDGLASVLNGIAEAALSPLIGAGKTPYLKES